jgi:hypothetical protein
MLHPLERPAVSYQAARAALENICAFGVLIGGMLVLMVYFAFDRSAVSIIRFVQGCAILAIFWYFDLNGILTQLYKAKLEEAGVREAQALITRAEWRSALAGAFGMAAFLGAFWLFRDIGLAGHSELSHLAVAVPCFLGLAFAFDRWTKSWVAQQVPATAQPPRDI